MNTSDLKKYANFGYNVILTGKHGVGKTAVVKEVFNELFGELGKDWLYFSASTLDPWVDFIGIPKNYTREDGVEVFKLIPPEHLAENNEIKAIFFDEINRAEEKTLNALMELIQFKSINGRKFQNLKCVWAAENPADDTDANYSVKALDPAQKDRFQIQLNFPEKLNKQYFIKKYGKELYEVSNDWWSKNSSKISPRKLDDILFGFINGFNINDFSNTTSLNELQHLLSSVGVLKIINEMLENTKDEKDLRGFFTLDFLRKNEKIINTSKEKNEIFSKIYEILPGEVQKYVSNSFNYNHKAVTNLGSVSLNVEQKNFFNKYHNKSTYIRREWNDKNAFEISKYIKELNSIKIKEIIDLVVYEKLFAQFPFVYDAKFTTPYIKRFITRSNINLNEIYNFMACSLYILVNDSLEDNHIKIVRKLLGSSDFVKTYILNKKRILHVINNIDKYKNLSYDKFLEMVKI